MTHKSRLSSSLDLASKAKRTPITKETKASRMVRAKKAWARAAQALSQAIGGKARLLINHGIDPIDFLI